MRTTRVEANKASSTSVDEDATNLNTPELPVTEDPSPIDSIGGRADINKKQHDHPKLSDIPTLDSTSNLSNEATLGEINKAGSRSARTNMSIEDELRLYIPGVDDTNVPMHVVVSLYKDLEKKMPRMVQQKLIDAENEITRLRMQVDNLVQALSSQNSRQMVQGNRIRLDSMNRGCRNGNSGIQQQGVNNSGNCSANDFEYNQTGAGAPVHTDSSASLELGGFQLVNKYPSSPTLGAMPRPDRRQHTSFSTQQLDEMMVNQFLGPLDHGQDTRLLHGHNRRSMGGYPVAPSNNLHFSIPKLMNHDSQVVPSVDYVHRRSQQHSGNIQQPGFPGQQSHTGDEFQNNIQDPNKQQHFAMRFNSIVGQPQDHKSMQQLYVPGVLTPASLLLAKPDSSKAEKGSKWTPEQDQALRIAVKFFKESNWKQIAHHVPGRDHVQCLQRWKKVLQPGLVKGAWSPQEDALLLQLTDGKTKKNWSVIANSVPGRTAKQCRERWSLNLDPTINRSPWTSQEDALLLALHKSHGNKWAAIKRELKGRTENAVKTRFTSLQRKRRKREQQNAAATSMRTKNHSFPAPTKDQASQSSAVKLSGVGAFDATMSSSMQQLSSVPKRMKLGASEGDIGTAIMNKNSDTDTGNVDLAPFREASYTA